MLKLFDRIDQSIAGWMDRNGTLLLRISLGIVFFWFGFLKLFKGMSPAAPLIARSITWFDPDIFIPVLGAWEMLIGAGLLVRKGIRFTLLLLFLQMPGTMLPLFLRPEDCFSLYPFDNFWEIFVLTTDGQYIIKNLVLISAAIVIGGTVRQKRQSSDSDDPARTRAG